MQHFCLAGLHGLKSIQGTHEHTDIFFCYLEHKLLFTSTY